MDEETPSSTKLLLFGAILIAALFAFDMLREHGPVVSGRLAEWWSEWTSVPIVAPPYQPPIFVP